jgi:hypothetical protein
MVTAPDEALVSVTGCDGPGDPIITVPKVRLLGETCNSGAGVAVTVAVAIAVGVAVGRAAVAVGVMAAPPPTGPVAVALGVAMKIPVPVMEITCGLFTALSVIVNVSERGPGCCGAKVTLIVHEALG